MKNIVTLIIALSPFFSCAQKSDRTTVLKVVNQVFEAMRTSDSTLLKDAFVENPTTYTVFQNKDGITQLRIGDFQEFIDAVGKPKEDVWNEPIWNEKVEIDGSLASVWVDYAFYLNKEFSHCGVDAFHLVKLDGRWRIFHLVDTRGKDGCTVPQMVKVLFEK